MQSKLIVFAVLFLMFNQLTSLGQQQVAIYENMTRQLEIYSDGTFVYKCKSSDLVHLAIPGIEIITYGTWQKKGKRYVLSSDASIAGPYVKADVNETLSQSQDSIYISIDAPFVSEKQCDKRLQNAYIYAIDVRYCNDSVVSFFSGSENFSLKKDSLYDILELKLKIIPYAFLGRDPFYHNLQCSFAPSRASNSFKVNIPSFSTFYIYHHLFDNETLTLKNKKTLCYNSMKLWLRSERHSQ